MIQEKKLLFSGNDSVTLRLVNTVEYVQRALIKCNSGTVVVDFEEREKAKAIIFKLLQEQFGDEMKSLEAEKEIPKGRKILKILTLPRWRGTS